MSIRDEIELGLRDGGGLIVLRDHPHLARSVQRLAGRGELHSPLAGIYCRSEDATELGIRVRAAMMAAPDAVITGPAAARLTFWPEVAVPVVTLSRRGRLRVRDGYRVCRERLPAELILERPGLRVTAPALTALDLVPWAGGSGIHEALRTGAATLDRLWDALHATPGRAGNSLRRAALRESRNCPWSEAERLLHLLLYRADIRGWSGNVTIECSGHRYPVDVAFRRRRVIIEVDGYAFHRAENVAQFHRDRQKWSNLTATGWTVLHFTWDHLVAEPEWVIATVRRALAVSQMCPAV